LVDGFDNISVIKIGGSTLGKHDTTIEDIVSLQRQGKSLVIVHGGGKLITEWLGKQGIETSFVRGERVTDRAALEVVISVLAGLVNKEIVAAINGKGGRAAGISGIDGGLILSTPKSAEDTALAKVILHSGYLPVVAPIGLDLTGGQDQAPQLLNINADLVAGEIAAAIGAQRLVFLTDVAGVCDEVGNVLGQISPDEAEALIASGVVSGGMIPKIRACLRASASGSATCIVDGQQPHALLQAIEGHSSGTRIQAVV
jgi:acetylglutamate kinase